MKLNYSNSCKSKIYNQFVLLIILFILTLTTFSLLTLTYESQHHQLIFYTTSILVIEFIIISIIIYQFIQKHIIIKKQLWKKGEKTEGFIVDIGSILHKHKGRYRIFL